MTSTIHHSSKHPRRPAPVTARSAEAELNGVFAGPLSPSQGCLFAPSYAATAPLKYGNFSSIKLNLARRKAAPSVILKPNNASGAKVNTTDI